MLKVSICLINYNSKVELINLLDSVNFSENLSLSIVVFDNSLESELADLLKNDYFFTLDILYDGRNPGYFGRIGHYLNHIGSRDYDFYIYGNCDLYFGDDFFERLKEIQLIKPLVIAPKIVNRLDSRSYNPKYVQKPSKFKVYSLFLIFKFRLLFFLYQKASFVYQKIWNKVEVDSHELKSIYCPHGALIIFNSKSTLIDCRDFPIFLFGEEIYLAEKCVRSKTPIIYYPELLVFNIGETSVGKMKNRNVHYVNSLKFILSEFY